MEAALPTLLVLASYGLGSVPFALLFGRWFAGVDIRTVGSGNVGATNAGRVLGRRGFAATLLLDALKGAVPVLVLAPLGVEEGADGELLRVACGLAAVLGHVFSVFLKFRGGKGVATTLGAILALSPVAAGITIAVFLLLALTSGIVSLGSVGAALAFPVAVYLLDGSREVLVFAVIVAVLVVVRHRGNVARIARGTEPRGFGRGQRGAVETEDSHGG